MASVYDNDEIIGQEEEGGQESFLVSGKEYAYVKPMWASGAKITYVLPKERKGDDATGFHYQVDLMPDDFLDAAKIMAEKDTSDGLQKQAEFVTVKHGDGNTKEYVRFNENYWYVLTHGTPTANGILTKIENQLGVAYGIMTYYNNDTQKHDTGSFVSVLAVHEGLYRAGYVDAETGAPKPILLNMKGISGKEFLKELSIHALLIKKAKQLGIADRYAQYWAHKQRLEAAGNTVGHGKEKSTQVYPIISFHKPEKEWDETYIQSLYCGTEMFLAMRPMVFETKPLRPGGEAVEWCRQVVANAVDNQKKFTGPKGQTLDFGKNQPAPEWLKNRKAIQDAGTYSPDAIHGTGNVPDDEESPLEAYKERIKGYQKFFAGKEHEEGIALSKKALDAANNAIGNPVDEVESIVLSYMTQLGKLQKSLRAANPYS